MKRVITIFILIIITFVLGQTIFAIGQITEPIVFKDVLRGQIIQETLILYGAEEKSESFGLVAEGDIKDWVTFYLPENLQDPVKEVNIPAKSTLNVIAQFKVPSDVPNGNYNGVVAVFSLPTKEKEQGVSTSVRLRVDREVSVAVTDQEIIKFQTAIIPLKYGVKEGESLQIKVIYENQGNVAIKPDLQLKILKDDQIIFNAIFPYPESEKSVRPLERKTLSSFIEWQTTGQKNGIYQAQTEILLNDQVYQKENFRFSVGEDGTLTGIAKGIKDINLKIFWPIIAIVVIVLVNVMLVVFIKKNLKRKEKEINY